MSETTFEAAERCLAGLDGRNEQWIRFRSGSVMAEYIVNIALTMARSEDNDDDRAYWFARHWRWLTADPGSEADDILDRVCYHLDRVRHDRGR